MSKSSEAVKRWRLNAKMKLILSFGGKCCICGYDKCDSAFEFHHLDPSEKETSWGQFRGNPKKWEDIINEMKKCIMVCSNCHKEIHAGFAVVPENAVRIDTNVVNVKTYSKLKEEDKCPICGKSKFIGNKFCSSVCSGKAGGQVDWDNVDLLKLLETNTKCKVAEMLSISEAAVRKRLKKINSEVEQSGNALAC